MLKIQNVGLRLDWVFIFIFYLPVWNTSYEMCCFGPFLEKKPKNVIIIILS